MSHKVLLKSFVKYYNSLLPVYQSHQAGGGGAILTVEYNTHVVSFCVSRK